MGLLRELFKPLRKPRENAKEDDSDPYLAILALRITKNSSGASAFFKTESDNDMDNDIEIEPKTRHSKSATEPGEVNEPRENETELRETSSYANQSGRRVIKPARYGE